MIKIEDVSTSLGPPSLVLRAGKLEPTDTHEEISARLLLNTLLIGGGNWPADLGQISVAAVVWFSKELHVWLAAVAYVNDSLADQIFGFGPTFKVDFGEPYDPKFDAELSELLRQDLG